MCRRVVADNISASDMNPWSEIFSVSPWVSELSVSTNEKPALVMGTSGSGN